MIYLVLGSNLGDRAWNLEQAKALLAESLHTDMLCSDILETEAVGFDGPPFLNQAVCFESDIAPEALLDLCQAVEEEVMVVNKKVADHENIKKPHFAFDEWTPDNGMLSQTLKPKRRNLNKRYAEVIASTYKTPA